jgi:hypothetical protein
MGGRDPAGQQGLAGGGQPFDLVELGSPAPRGLSADRVRV